MSCPTLSSRSSMESLQSNSSSILSSPDKLAPAIIGPSVWQGDELNPAEYSCRNLIQIANLPVVVCGLSRTAISASTFRIDNAELANKLSKISTELHQGTGVVVLRGLDAAYLNDEEAVIAFAGVCAYICPDRATDSYANQTLSHVLDATKKPVPEDCRNIGLAGSKITAAMDFHSDRFSGDVIALYVRNDGGPGAGGEQFVASFSKIYNELLEKDPEVLETMAEPDWPFELKHKSGVPYLELGPTLFFSKGRPICQLVKAPLLGTDTIPRHVGMPKVTAKQLHAMHAVEELARRFCTKVDRQQGDIQFLHNLNIMHARAAYRGINGCASTRHLLRMFLRDSTNAWEKPASCRNNFDDPFTPGRRQNLPVLDLDPWRTISGRESHG
ncbi:family Taurine catabolism dioxygenase [Pyrenophora seminiperda CCB06]|uniref:Family Taurine catabolism dioxygenase n=1 Tax=Pyrenophora seminiperda CCB06 TaxID=1302712 RepID=A0A3M7MI67_9PLEO|nr:family Taurine catabolism dioxygenase [Pyrenophora seminiperda CCB06]